MTEPAAPPPPRPTRFRRTPLGSRAGFGLIEAIVALAIAGLVLAAVTEMVGRMLRTWDRGFATLAAVERTDVALGRIGADLAALLPISLATADDPNILFAGDARGMSFTAVTPFDRSHEGIAIVEIAVEGSGDGAVLVRRLRRGRDAPLRDGDRVVLLSGRLDLGFSYRDQTGERVDRWSRPGEVPRGVVVTLTGGRGGGLPVEVMLPIPVAISVSCLAKPPGESVDAPQDQNAPTGAPRPPRAAPPQPGAGETDTQSEPGDPPPVESAEDRAKRCATGPAATKAPPPGDPAGAPGPRSGENR